MAAALHVAPGSARSAAGRPERRAPVGAHEEEWGAFALRVSDRACIRIMGECGGEPLSDPPATRCG
eukprot:7339306-Prymnesium_polylepis.4